MKYICLLFPVVFILFSCNGPFRPVGYDDISAIGSWIPSTTNFQQYTYSGTFVSDTSYNMFEFFNRWGIMKYVKVDSTMVTVYTFQGNELVYGDTSYCDATGDSIKIRSSFHGAAKTDTTLKEFLIKEKGNLYITSEYMMSNPSVKILWKTKLTEYDSILPCPAWASNVQYR